MTRELDTRFRGILNQRVTPALRNCGFVKKGQVYEHIGRGVSWIVDVCRNPLKTRNKSAFTLECGIHLQSLMSIYLNRPEPRRINIGYDMGSTTDDKSGSNEGHTLACV